jgi:cytochrome c biogenesis protein CcmG/thiol:disulfide interchange protein DsbE
MLKKSIFPFLAFLVLLAFLALGLNRNPGEIPSPFIGQAAPHFELAGLSPDQGSISPRSMLGQVWILNVWASWCVACRDEHPFLIELSSRETFAIIGLNYKDNKQDAIAWLDRFGNPYTGIAVDQTGDTGIDYGVYGVPETFVIDRNGIVRMKHIGALTRDDIEQKLIPLLSALDQQEG